MNKGILIIGILMIILLSCTQKSNIVGSGENDNPEPISLSIDSFEPFVSYEDSIKNSNSYNLTVGKYETTEAITLLKFTSLPDTAFVLENVHLSFRIKERHNFDDINETNFKLAQIISEDWFENTATYFSPSDSTNWNIENFSTADYEIIDEITADNYQITDDSLDIVFPIDILHSWIADSTNYGLAIIAENSDSFIEIYSSEISDELAPKICFDLQETIEDTTMISYQEKFDHDVFIYSSDNTFSVFPSEMKLSNIQPIRSFIKFNIEDSMFINVLPPDYIIKDTFNFMQQLTINRAELVLTSTDENLYPLEGSFRIEPYLVLTDSIDFSILEPDQPIIDSEDIEDLFIIGTTDTLDSQEFKIDITKIISGYISGEYDNKGILLKSVYENKNFIHEEFKTDEIEMRIIFLPPYLNE